tara:strand:+ start:823 stop:1290 length:468 start_codon:yes stop_codon:yes gene_type:complete
MFVNFKNHGFINIILFLIFLNACQLQEPSKNHGLLFLENRSNKLIVNQTNKNDIIKMMGKPHSTSINDDNTWFYIERTLTKGKYHKLGKNILKTNNILVLNFDKYGVLKIKEFLDKEDLQKINFSKAKTENELTKKSFVEKFLSSIKQKMYSNQD